jgi:16S rRNA processing protein RimM
VSDPDLRRVQQSAKWGSNETTGSTEPRFLAIGCILRPHGVRGEVVVEVLTDFPERFEAPDQLYVGDSFTAELKRVSSTRWHKNRVLLSFEGCTDRNCAETLRDRYVVVPLEQAKLLPEDTYYAYQLTGLQVVSSEGEDLGKIVDVLFMDANDIYVVEGPRGQILLPAIADVIDSIDVERGQVTVNLIPGLE